MQFLKFLAAFSATNVLRTKFLDHGTIWRKHDSPPAFNRYSYQIDNSGKVWRKLYGGDFIG